MTAPGAPDAARAQSAGATRDAVAGTPELPQRRTTCAVAPLTHGLHHRDEAIMTNLLHLATYLAAAAVGWLALLLVVATLIHGRAWVWTRTRESWRRARHRLPHHGVLGRPVALSRDQPVAFAPRGGWL